MKKTAQFGLNQWEMSDRIQMQDFNRDNETIDAALETIPHFVIGTANFTRPATPGTVKPRNLGHFRQSPCW